MIKINRNSIFCIFLIFGILSLSNRIVAQDSSATINKLRIVADMVVNNSTFKFIGKESGSKYSSTKEVVIKEDLIPESPYTDWKYWNGVLNLAMMKLGKELNNPIYTQFAIKNVAFSFDNYKFFESRYQNQGKWNYPYAQRFITEELDDCGAMGASVLEVYKLDKQERYLEYIKHAANHIMNKQSRLKDGTFVRSFPHKWTLWADDLYMGLSFLCRMGEFSGDRKYFNDAVKQVIHFHKYLFNETVGLMHHFWYSDVNRRGVAHWGRANGWAMLAQVELLDKLPLDHPKRYILIELLQKHILGIARYQSSTGLWHQLLDKTDSYLETSCSAIFTYCVARAVNKGYIEPRYASIAIRGWEGVMKKINEDGKLEGVCTGTVTSDDLVYYYNRPAPLNDVHGIGFILFAGSEVLQFKKGE